MPIRAKFRCLSTTRRYDKTNTAELRPVYNRKTSQNYEENLAFWNATPTGVMELTFHGDMPVKEGDFYFIDLAKLADFPDDQRPESRWRTATVTTSSDNGSGEVLLVADWDRKLPMLCANLKLTLSGESAKVEDFGKPGTKWAVEVTLARAGTDED